MECDISTLLWLRWAKVPGNESSKERTFQGEKVTPMVLKVHTSHRATPDRTRPAPCHRACTGPEMTDDFLLSSRYGQTSSSRLLTRRPLRVELKGVRRANYLQLTKGMNSSRRSWWLGFKVGMEVFSFLLIQLKPKQKGFQANAATRELNTSAHQKHEPTRRLRSRTGPARLIVIADIQGWVFHGLIR